MNPLEAGRNFYVILDTILPGLNLSAVTSAQVHQPPTLHTVWPNLYDQFHDDRIKIIHSLPVVIIKLIGCRPSNSLISADTAFSSHLPHMYNHESVSAYSSQFCLTLIHIPISTANKASNSKRVWLLGYYDKLWRCRGTRKAGSNLLAILTNCLTIRTRLATFVSPQTSVATQNISSSTSWAKEQQLINLNNYFFLNYAIKLAPYGRSSRRWARVWTPCPGSLLGNAADGNRTSDQLIASPVL